jgi:hypothetical protein
MGGFAPNNSLSWYSGRFSRVAANGAAPREAAATPVMLFLAEHSRGAVGGQDPGTAVFMNVARDAPTVQLVRRRFLSVSKHRTASN